MTNRNGTDVIDVTGREVVVHEQPGALFAGETPQAVAARMRDTARALKSVIESAHGSDGKPLLMTIPGVPGKYVRCEGWTTLGSMVGVFPVLIWTRPCPDGWEARVEARTMSGQTVGAAEAMCTREERSWSKRDEFALRSMAQTRATSKALRMPLGFVMTLAGYDATPAEEMPPNRGNAPAPRPRQAAQTASDHGPRQRLREILVEQRNTLGPEGFGQLMEALATSYPAAAAEEGKSIVINRLEDGQVEDLIGALSAQPETEGEPDGDV
ncbi:MAG: hypothetical protein KGK07_12910 [Chloroflexota bacterium]|nr:hypothetical protein [Chloroflexota bacterium]